MMTIHPNAFVLRRAFRLGRVLRGDVQDAYPEFSYSKAGLALNAALDAYPEHLERDGRSVVPMTRAETPAVASEADLLETLGNGLFAMRHTGFRPEELPARQIRWSCSMPRKAGVLSAITQTMARRGGLEIRYVGLRVGETGRWRRIVPLSLEQMGAQWRVLAQCLESEGYPIKIFVLSRILDAIPMRARPPEDFTRETDTDTLATFAVTFDERLTADQREVLAAELCLKEGCVQLARRSRWEFERQYGHAPPHQHIVWPPVVRLDEQDDGGEAMD
jgi:hypothetical protein